MVYTCNKEKHHEENEVEIGGLYYAKVSGKIVPVRIIGLGYQCKGWNAVNVTTGRSIRIKTAARLRGPASDPSLRRPT